MSTISLSTETFNYFLRGMKSVLPDLMKLHSYLHSIADPDQRITDISFNDLASKLNLEPSVLASNMYTLRDIQFIAFKKPRGLDSRFSAEILVNLHDDFKYLRVDTDISNKQP